VLDASTSRPSISMVPCARSSSASLSASDMGSETYRW
jgi:hypothetical protein